MRAILKNNKVLFYQLIGRFSKQGLGFLFGIILVRISGLTVSGTYFGVISVCSITLGPILNGIRTNFLRNNLPSQFKIATATSFIAFAILVIPLMLIALFLGYSPYFVLLIGISFFLLQLAELYDVTMRLIGKDKLAILPKIVPVALLCILVFIFQVETLIPLGLLASGCWIFSFFFYARLLALWKKRIVLIRDIKIFFTNSIFIAGGVIFNQLYANTDQLMIKYFYDDQSVGLYRIGYSLSLLVMPTVGVFAYLYLSRLKRLIESTNKVELRKKFYQQICINLGLGLVFLIWSYFFNPYLVPFIYGEAAEGAIWVSIILSVSVLLNAVSMAFTYTILAYNKDKFLFQIAGLGALTNITLNYLFLHTFGMGIEGAAYASIFTQVVTLSVCIYKLLELPIFKSTTNV